MYLSTRQAVLIVTFRRDVLYRSQGVSIFLFIATLSVTHADPLLLAGLRIFGRGRTFVMNFYTIFWPMHKTNLNQVYTQLSV